MDKKTDNSIGALRKDISNDVSQQLTIIVDLISKDFRDMKNIKDDIEEDLKDVQNHKK